MKRQGLITSINELQKIIRELDEESMLGNLNLESNINQKFQ